MNRLPLIWRRLSGHCLHCGARDWEYRRMRDVVQMPGLPGDSLALSA